MGGYCVSGEKPNLTTDSIQLTVRKAHIVDCKNRRDSSHRKIASPVLHSKFALKVNSMANTEGFHAVANTTGQFANNFLKVVASDNPGNLITSPLSAQVVLAMAAYGASGTTGTQMRSALLLPSDDGLGQSGYRSLIETLNAVKGVELRLANKLYTASKFEVKDAFKKLTEDKFLSASAEVDFASSLAAAATINTWCEEQTNKRIKDVISPDSLDEDTRLVLVNAVYFKGQWEKKFDPSRTEDRPFHLDEETTKSVPTMFIKKKFRFGHLPELEAKIIEIPYQGEETSMVIFLPNEVGGLKKVQDNLHQVNISEKLRQMHTTEVELYLPKFRLESTLDLNGSLQKMGMTDMFQNQADFSQIADVPLKISKVVQKAFIEVNEEGCEAAAATGMMIQTRCLVFAEEVLVDRPFGYMIISSIKGTGSGEKDIIPLFTGYVVNPSS